MRSTIGDEWWTELKSITLHDSSEPPSWPAGASEEYREARRRLSEAELALRDQAEAVAALRRELPAGAVLPEYRLTEVVGDEQRAVTLADLFGEHDELVVYHLMFHPDDDEACPMCSMWVDGFNGVAAHIGQRAGLAAVAKAPVDKLRAYGRYRGWDRIRLVSAYESDLPADLGAESPGGGQWPALSVFTRDGTVVRHAYTQSADFPDRSARGIDLLSPVWNVLDLLPSGRGDWLPHNNYAGRHCRE
ncbi:DUF899 family protein [Pseudonocardia spinosispora]|uniref:DUF899 family protein n=1 Tax=Pseudonocardia spinosispora TaxID=103441 RepID=UPI000415707F|nr:DUF899 family protein [Pseudonocardia spinosispora]